MRIEPTDIKFADSKGIYVPVYTAVQNGVIGMGVTHSEAINDCISKTLKVEANRLTVNND